MAADIPWRYYGTSLEVEEKDLFNVAAKVVVGNGEHTHF